MSFPYDITGDIIYIWEVTPTPAKLGILNNQYERIWYPPKSCLYYPPNIEVMSPWLRKWK